MTFRTAFALAVAALTVGVPVSGATPDGYQPQLRPGPQPDAIDRYLRNNAAPQQPDALDRYLADNAAQQVETQQVETAAAGHPDSHAVRPSPSAEIAPVDGAGRDWATGAVGALGGVLVAVLAIVGASAMRERRRLVLR